MQSSLFAVVLVLLGSSCASAPQPVSAPASDPAHARTRTWTTAFLREAVLVADEIIIEGPADLLEHIALRQDKETTIYSSKTTTEGLLQELQARPEAGLEVRGQLDAWSLAAFRKITVLQRPGEVPVTVRALGHAFWAPADGSGERREEQLVFRGPHGG